MSDGFIVSTFTKLGRTRAHFDVNGKHGRNEYNKRLNPLHTDTHTHSHSTDENWFRVMHNLTPIGLIIIFTLGSINELNMINIYGVSQHFV